ncbi:hypothetical protein PBI_SHEPARD_72 [Arthrobacter phage Shepard]|nr:hypothetical protein PBI_SHEPARD_72 [Arthrobacter phage Shepard]UYL88281.1 hypothetical protein SEA_LILHUDDY_71 [Arthrobacter phage LilHuddy]
MGAGLKPTFKPACPKCDFTLGYYVRDPDVHPDKWVLNEASRQHLKEAHVIVVPEVRAIHPVRSFRSRRRLLSSKRRVLV